MKIIKNPIVFTLIVLLFATCTSNTIYKKPKDLIPEDQMVDLLVDLYIANAAYNSKTKKSLKKIDYLPLIYEKYHIDSLRFRKSNIYYMSRIDDYDTLYGKVKARLKHMLDTTEARQKLIDSIKAIGLLEQRNKSKTKDQKVKEQE